MMLPVWSHPPGILGLAGEPLPFVLNSTGGEVFVGPKDRLVIRTLTFQGSDDFGAGYDLIFYLEGSPFLKQRVGSDTGTQSFFWDLGTGLVCPEGITPKADTSVPGFVLYGLTGTIIRNP